MLIKLKTMCERERGDWGESGEATSIWKLVRNRSFEIFQWAQNKIHPLKPTCISCLESPVAHQLFIFWKLLQVARFWKLQLNGCMQAQSHNNWAWDEYMERIGRSKASQLCVFIWEKTWGRREITLLISIQKLFKNENQFAVQMAAAKSLSHPTLPQVILV